MATEKVFLLVRKGYHQGEVVREYEWTPDAVEKMLAEMSRERGEETTIEIYECRFKRAVRPKLVLEDA